MFSQWVRRMGVPLGRLSCPQVSGVWGIRSKDRTARKTIKIARTGNTKRINAIYHCPAMGHRSSSRHTVSTSACAGAVNISISLPPFGHV